MPNESNHPPVDDCPPGPSSSAPAGANSGADALPPDLEQGAIAAASCVPTMHGAISQTVRDDIPPPKADFSAPPPYEAATATKLPTYEEVQREKTIQGEAPYAGPSSRPSAMSMFLTIDTEPKPEEEDTSLLGTDFMFYTAFIVAFLFNWIGFLLLMCFCHTIAARYGALSGFGLSLAKWTLIVKHSTGLASRDNSWPWWLITAFGFLICARAFIQYLHIKRGWRLLSYRAQERLMCYY